VYPDFSIPFFFLLPFRLVACSICLGPTFLLLLPHTLFNFAVCCCNNNYNKFVTDKCRQRCPLYSVHCTRCANFSTSLHDCNFYAKQFYLFCFLFSFYFYIAFLCFAFICFVLFCLLENVSLYNQS